MADDIRFRVDAGVVATREALADARVLARCLPATRVDGEATRDRATGRSKIAFGSSTVTYGGSLTVLTRGSDTVEFELDAKEVRGGTPLHGLVQLAVTEADGGTEVTLQARVPNAGRLAVLRAEAVEHGVQTLIRRFAGALQQELVSADITSAIPGTIQVLTERPVVVDHPDTFNARLRELVADNRWLIPAAIVAVMAGFVAMRRRS